MALLKDLLTKMDEIKLIYIDPEDDPRWDEFVKGHAMGWLVHMSGWKRILEESFPHMKGHYLALENTNTKELQAAMPLYEVRSWLLGNRLVSIPYATLSDPLVSDEKQKKILIAEALRMQRELKCNYIEIRTNSNGILHKSNIFHVNNDHKCHFLDISEGEEIIWKNFSYKSIRYEINKALKFNVTIKSAKNEKDLQAFYELYMETRKRLGLPAQPYMFFKSIFNQFKSKGQADYLLASIDSKIIAGHLSLKFNNRVSVEATGISDSARNTGVDKLLYWHNIRKACSEGYEIFDFGRTSIQNTSLTAFKNRWGTDVSDLCTFYYNSNDQKADMKLNERSLSYKSFRFIFNKAPKCFQPVLSRFCYRHLG